MSSICEASGETIEARPTEHFGSHLAAAGRPARPVRVTTRTTGSGRRSKPMAALRVLVMEDDSVIAELLGEMPEGMGHDVCAIEATEADSILAAVRCKPDLMIVDVQLGEGSGVSAVDAIHRHGPIPHVFVSGNIAKIKALPRGSITIQKPYREAELVQRFHGTTPMGTRPISARRPTVGPQRYERFHGIDVLAMVIQRAIGPQSVF
jgi:two-component system, response regulator PdtaR